MSRERRPSKTHKRRAQGDAVGTDFRGALRSLTAARVGLERSGASLATGPLLDFRLAHARARDAVHAPLDDARLLAELSRLGLPTLAVASAAKDRAEYLMRPDLGRRLIAADRARLNAARGDGYDVVFVVTEGLSAQAMAHVHAVLAELFPALRRDRWRVAPLVLVRLGRVAVGDAVAEALNADIAAVLIGERPGLSAPDSMGTYLTWRPSAVTTDADRNCISNIRAEGLRSGEAAMKLLHLLRAMRAQRGSGVALKDTGDELLLDQ